MKKVVQEPGLKHISNLKREARRLWKEYDNTPGMWDDCIKAVMYQHRLDLISQKILDKQNEPKVEPIASCDEYE